MTDEQKAQVLSQVNADTWDSPEYKEIAKRSMEWEGSKEQAEFINRQHDAVLDVLIDADAWTSHEPWKGKTVAEQVKIFVDRALAAEKELAAVKRELHAAALWDDDSDKTTTPSVQVYVLHQKLIERADDCRVWDRRYEAAIKTMGIITRHRNELEAEVKRLQEKAPQPAQTTREKQPLPKPRIPIRPLPHNSGGKFDAKRSIDTLNETVEDLVSAVNDLQRWACE